MTLTPRERVLRTLRHEPVDRLPTQVNYTTTMGQRMSEHFGVSARNCRRDWVTTWCAWASRMNHV